MHQWSRDKDYDLLVLLAHGLGRAGILVALVTCRKA